MLSAWLPATAASAHVKWFCAFDVAGQPRGLENVLCPDFELLLISAVAALTIGAVIEKTSLGAHILRALDRATDWPRAYSAKIVAFGCAAFFVALWSWGGVLLTPELKTQSPYIPWLQLAIAFGLILRLTSKFAALGIVYLFLTSVAQYGLFHLMDYPIFVGLAAYLILNSFQVDFFRFRPVDVLRVSVAITLMWASIEKWAYPEWTFPLFIIHPGLAMGFDSEFYMRAAGMVEFALAFALLLSPLPRRLSALMLLGMFFAAMPVFGMIDIVGHTPIIVALIAIIFDNCAYKTGKFNIALVPLEFVFSLSVTLFLYYEMHSLIFNTKII